MTLGITGRCGMGMLGLGELEPRNVAVVLKEFSTARLTGLY